MMDNPTPPPGAGRFLPRIGSPAYHLMLAGVAILILGPLGGISAAFMNFSIGFFIGGQVLAGILGSTVTLPYGPEGKHGANYMQTMAASVAGMCGMAVLVQAMVWLGLPEPPVWQLVLYFMSIGMFGVGVGMLYTPVLVDRMQLTFPSGFAVANILRALTDKDLLKRSIAKLGGGMFAGYLGGAGHRCKIRPSARGAGAFPPPRSAPGMIVGARIAIPALVVGLIGFWQTPYLVRIGWLGPSEPFRKIGFIISLGTILGAAILDLALILIQAARRLPAAERRSRAKPAEDWKRVNVLRLVLWVAFWGAATVIAWEPGAAPTGLLPLRRGGAVLVVRAGQRHLAGHLGLEPDLERVRADRLHPRRAGAARSRAWACCARRFCSSRAAKAATCSRTARPAGGSAPTASSNSATRSSASPWARCWPSRWPNSS